MSGTNMSVATPPHQIARPSSSRLHPNTGQDAPLMSRSPGSAISSRSASSIGHPPGHPLRRRSTETSGGLDYYWSSLAGNGADSSASSVGASPSSSFAALSPNHPSNTLPSNAVTSQNLDQQVGLQNLERYSRRSKSSVNLRDSITSIHDLEDDRPALPHRSTGPLPSLSLNEEFNDNSREFVRNKAPQLPGLNINHGPTVLGQEPVESPGGWSGNSDYSPSPRDYAQSSTNVYHGHRRIDSTESKYSDSHPTPIVPDAHRFREATQGRSPIIPKRSPRLDELREDAGFGEAQTTSGEYNDEVHRTPIAPPYQDNHITRTPQMHFDGARLVRRSSPSNSHASTSLTSPVQTTPTRATYSTGASPSASGYTPGSGRQKFFASPSQSPQDIVKSRSPPLSASSTFIQPSRSLTNSTSGRSRSPAPQSAPPTKTEFAAGPPLGQQLDQENSSDTPLNGNRHRNTMPSPVVPSSSSGKISDNLLSPEKDFLTPERPSSASRGSTSPVRSPEPPPRSSLRNHFVHSASGNHLELKQTAPLSISPRGSPRTGSPRTLPTIINTRHSPDTKADPASSSASLTGPKRPSRSPSRASEAETVSISELTDMLSGSIHDLTLQDPTKSSTASLQTGESQTSFVAGSSSEGNLGAKCIEPEERGVIPVQEDSQPVATSIAERQPRSSEASPMLPPPVPSSHSVKRLGSNLSLNQTSRTPSFTGHSSTVSLPKPQIPNQWPSAMMYGNIKAIRYPGDRAKAYARHINELARAESGLKDWCATSAARGHQGGAALFARRQPTRASLGVRSSSYSSSTLGIPHDQSRNVSAGSEFPMRQGQDASHAKEISQRMIDPADQPSGLPPNLPYPQLQQAQMAAGGNGGGMGGMKPSMSMQSIASTSSKKGGFFSNIGKRSGKKESTSLGPPSSASRKDIRGLPISSPTMNRSTSPQKFDDSSHHQYPGYNGNSGMNRGGPGNVPGPNGPRPPRVESFTPPPAMRDPVEAPGRSSLDTGLSRLGNGNHQQQQGRGSLDGNSGIPRHFQQSSSPMAQQQSRGSPVKESDLKSMSEVLPHVSGDVLRMYLAKYGDSMRAVGVYLEDEKRGKTLRA